MLRSPASGEEPPDDVVEEEGIDELELERYRYDEMDEYRQDEYRPDEVEGYPV